jgi:hypothetical protein
VYKPVPGINIGIDNDNKDPTMLIWLEAIPALYQFYWSLLGTWGNISLSLIRNPFQYLIYTWTYVLVVKNKSWTQIPKLSLAWRKTKNLMEYLKVYHLLEWNRQNWLIIQQTCVGVTKVLWYSHESEIWKNDQQK